MEGERERGEDVVVLKMCPPVWIRVARLEGGAAQ